MTTVRVAILSLVLAPTVLLVLQGCAPVPPVAQARLGEQAWRIIPPPIPILENVVGGGLSPGAAVAQVTEYFDVGSSPSDLEVERSPQLKKVSKSVEMNFQDADVRGVIGAVLGEMLKLNYSIDPAIQGKITLRTGKPILYDSAMPALEAALTTVSAALIVQDGMVQVIPLENAPKRVRRAQRLNPAQTQVPGFAIEIIPLRYISAKEMQRVLESFAPKGSVLQADEAHNHLVIAGTSQDRTAIAQTVAGFDMDGMQGMHFALFKIDQIDPELLIAELRQIFLPPMELITQRVRLVPIARLQTILGISKYRADLEMLESWVRKLDRTSKTGGRRLFVYNVQNGSAKDLAKSLQLVMGGERTELISTVASPTKDGAGQAADVTSSSQATTQLALSGNQPRIVANEENNSLLIFGSEQEYGSIRDALRQLDIMPRQVMIEALLAEVTLGDNLKYGVQWFFNSGNNTMTLSSSDSGAINSQFPGFSYIYSGAADARLVLNALQERNEVKILSSPKLSVLNNQKAELLVGDQIPVLTQLAQGTAAPGAPVVTSIQMRDTGVILEVIPRISENGNVILDVTQEVSDVTSTTTSGIDSPTIQRRRLRSVIATRDGATVALGGLIRDVTSGGRSGIPVLGDIPLLGNLFRTNTTTNRRTELIVLLVPHVMRNHEETQAVVEALLDNLPSASELGNHGPPIQVKPKQ